MRQNRRFPRRLERMYRTGGHASGRFRGFGAMALVLAFSILMSLGWSAHQAAATPLLLPARTVVGQEGGQEGGQKETGTVLTSGDLLPDEACLPRPPGVETCRQALPAPPDPKPASLLDLLLPGNPPGRVENARHGPEAAHRPGNDSRGPRVPTGPPSA